MKNSKSNLMSATMSDRPAPTAIADAAIPMSTATPACTPRAGGPGASAARAALGERAGQRALRASRRGLRPIQRTSGKYGKSRCSRNRPITNVRKMHARPATIDHSEFAIVENSPTARP